jgi:hypothetical protein
MSRVRSDLIIPLGRVETRPLVEFWRWLLPETLRPWFATALGDLFLQGTDRRVWWLDVGSGELQAIAGDEREFTEPANNPDKAVVWFGETLADALRASGLALRPGECYSYLSLPILGGQYAPGNFRVYDVVTHFRVWGPIHEKIKDLPEGAQVQFEVK